MPSYDPNLFNVDPYYDDYSEDKKHLRIMFRPGYGVQARELTQLQTILQNQIERFGSHVFDEGSIVLDGKITTNNLKYARVTLGSGITHTDFIGTTIYNGSVSAPPFSSYGRVVHAEGGIVGDPSPVLFFEYLAGGTGFVATNSIVATGANDQTITATVTGSVGNATVVSVDRGVRFVEGYFVLNDAQSIGAYSLSGSMRSYETPTTSVGFSVNKEFVNSDEDETLTDPAFGYYNYFAPGADRFKIDLVLSQRGYTAADTTSTDNFSRQGFVEFMRIVDGDIVKVEKYPDYAMLEDTFARRTYDESGNYTVVPFDLTMRGISGSDTTLKAHLSPGKAYVFGYEFETQGVTRLNIDKARTTRQVERVFDREVGPYTKVTFSGITGSIPSGLQDFGLDPVLIMVTGSSGQGDANKRIVGEVGRARMRRADLYANPVFNLSLYDISLTAGASFSQVERFFVSGVTHCDRHLFAVTGGSASLGALSESSLLWEIPDGSVMSTLDDIDIAYTYQTSVVPNIFPYNTTIAKPTIGNYFSVSTAEVSLPNADVIVFDQNGRILGGTAARNGTSLDITVSGSLSQSNRLHVMASVDYDTSDPIIKTKTIVTENITLTGAWGSALTGDGRGSTADTLYFNGAVDVISVLALTGSKDGSSTNLLPYFTFDNGQREDMYDWSRMTMNPETMGITGEYTATISRYQRSGGGATATFFTAESYTGGSLTSDYVPTFTAKSGTVYRLRDCIDFRPDRGATFSLVSQVSSSSIIPTNTAANDSQFIYTHFLPRIDKVALTRDRNFSVIKGVPALNPEPPADNPNAMTLYTLGVNPFTFGPDDVTVRQVENKRYTMRDIGDLEKRIEAVEYYTTLNILEQDAKSISVKDTAGDEMPKRGIVVDQFKGHIVSDNADPMFAASIDYELNELRPSFSTTAFSLTGGTLVGMTGNRTDKVFVMNHTASGEIANIVSSDYIKINPFGVVSFLGNMKISPSSDVWFDTGKRPKVQVNVGGENDNWEVGASNGFGTRYNDWESIWFGKNLSAEKVSKPNLSPSRLINAKVDGVALNSLNSSTTPDSIKKRVVEKSVIKDVLPIARENAINITAKGLKPNTPFYVYCDDLYVTPFCTGQSVTDTKGEITNLAFLFNRTSVGNNYGFNEQNFPVGRHVIRIVGSESPVTNVNTLIENPDTWTMSADAVYVAEGFYDSLSESNILSTRLPLTKRKSAKSTRVISNLSEVVNSAGEVVGYQEPLCQTFLVDANKYPNGMFVSFIDLYFRAKDSSATVPVSVEIRPTVNGYPHPSRVLPFASSTLYSDSVNIGDRVASGDDDKTRFQFSTPVYLLPGTEYAVCVSSNSPVYSLFTSNIGSFAIKDNESDPDLIVAKQPNFGSLFKTQNAGKLTKTENESLCMRVGVCKFTSETNTIQFSKSDAFGSDVTKYNSIRFNTAVSLPEGCSYTIRFDNDPDTGYESGKNIIPTSGTIDLNGVNSGNAILLSFATADTYVSPMFDLERSSVVMTKNIINSNSNTTTNGELEPTNYAVGEASRAKARYITKRITLEPDITARNVTVKMSLSNPVNRYNNNNQTLLSSSVKVFIRPLPVGETDFNKVNYIELTPSDTGYSYTDGDFREVTFTNIGDETLPEFNSFSIKVTMFGDDDGIVYPRVRNLRVVAT
jgi:hypothetical protein